MGQHELAVYLHGLRESQKCAKKPNRLMDVCAIDMLCRVQPPWLKSKLVLP